MVYLTTTSSLSSVHFENVVDVVTELTNNVLRNLLYAEDLFLIRRKMKYFKNKYGKWKAFENKGIIIEHRNQLVINTLQSNGHLKAK